MMKVLFVPMLPQVAAAVSMLWKSIWMIRDDARMRAPAATNRGTVGIEAPGH
jgi:hypothetical protein